MAYGMVLLSSFLTDAAKAQELSQGGHVRGKIVLEVRE